MRIKQFFITGFGIFANEHVAELSPGLNLFVGDNEAGKSTLLNFLRAILFGFGPRRGEADRYEPEGQAEHGGVLTVEFARDTQTYKIARKPGKVEGAVEVTMPDGTAEDDSFIRDRLPGVTKDLFRNVFAFSLDELQTHDSLLAQDVRSRIYSYGTAGAGSVVDAERGLGDEMDKLFKPGGRNPLVNTILSEMDRLSADIRGLKDSSAEYEGLRAELDELDKTLQQDQDELRGIDKQIVELERLDNVWEDWESLCTAREEFDELPPIDQRLIDSQAEIDALGKGHDHFESALGDLPIRELEARQARKDLEGSLSELGDGWTEERVSKFETSIPTRGQVRQHAENLRATREAVSQASADRAAIEPIHQQNKNEWVQVLEERAARAHWSSVALAVGLGLGAVLAVLAVLAGPGSLLGRTLLSFAAIEVIGVLALRAILPQLSRASVTRAQERQAATGEQLDTAREREEQASDELEKEEAQWSEWLKSRGLPEAMMPETALDVLRAVDLARDRLKAVQTAEERETQVRTSVERHEGRCRQVFEMCGRTAPARDELLLDVSRLQEDLKQSLATADKAKEIQALERTLQRAAGAGQRADFESKLADTDRVSIQAELEDKRTQREALAAEIGKNQEERGRKDGKIRDIERSDELSTALQKRGSLRAQLDRDVSRWAVRAICKEVLAKTRRKFEREKQPGVMRFASSFLGKITNTAYSRVFSPLESEEVAVETPQGVRRGVLELSRGTREQLYLSLRFGLIREYEASSEPLPVIMDDILVNFDPKRARSAADAIAGLAESNQVLFFTCHPEIAQMLQNADHSTARFEIRDRSISR